MRTCTTCTRTRLQEFSTLKPEVYVASASQNYYLPELHMVAGYFDKGLCVRPQIGIIPKTL